MIDRQTDQTQERSTRSNPRPAATHVQQRVLSVVLEVDAGSDTNITLSVPDSGGFLAAYGNRGYEKLSSLQKAMSRAIGQWFDENPADFSISGS